MEGELNSNRFSRSALINEKRGGNGTGEGEEA